MNDSERLALLQEKLRKLVEEWREEAQLPALREASNAFLMELCAKELEDLTNES